MSIINGNSQVFLGIMYSVSSYFVPCAYDEN